MRENKLVNDEKQKTTRSNYVVSSKVAGFRFPYPEPIVLVSSVEGLRNSASSMEENLIILHGVKHIRLRNEGFLRELV